MENLKVKIKKMSEEAVIPTYAHDGEDACFDLYCTSTEIDDVGNLVCHTGLAFEIPQWYVGLLFPRSSIANKEMFLTNSVGVIDSNYRGEVTAKFKPTMSFRPSKNTRYEAGERVVQMMILPYPHIEFEEVDELLETSRGDGGYGSTWK